MLGGVGVSVWWCGVAAVGWKWLEMGMAGCLSLTAPHSRCVSEHVTLEGAAGEQQIRKGKNSSMIGTAASALELGLI